MNTYASMKSLHKLLPIMLLLGACSYAADPVGSAVETPAVSATETRGPAFEPTLPISGAVTVEPTQAARQLAVYPPNARPGIVELDAVVDAVLGHDEAVLRGLSGFVEAACTHADGLGGPPKCGPDEADGTMVEVMPFLGPEGHFMRKADYMSWPGPDVRGLLAAYRVSDQAYSEPIYPAGEYAIVFLNADGSSVLTVQVRDGQVVRFDESAGGSLETQLAREAADVLLPLATNPIPTPVPWTAFNDPRGRFAFVYPPTWELSPGSSEETWRLGDQVEVMIAHPGKSWVACFDQALGDCPAVEDDRQVVINGREARRVKGYFGSVGGRTPQEFLSYIFELDGDQLVLTAYALPFDAKLQDMTQVWPLQGMHLELFERSVHTVEVTS